MPIITDYHTHTPLSGHATGTPAEYILAAKAAGITEYGISDHAPAMTPELFSAWLLKESDFPAYLRWIEEARAEAVKHGITLRMGLECDWFNAKNRTQLVDWIAHLRSLAPWDYFIGSVHFLDDSKCAVDDPFDLLFWKLNSVEEAWERYWHTYTEMVSTGLFDIMGHADLIKKFGFYPSGDLKRYYLPAVEAMARTGAVLEINTSGWDKTCAEQYPSSEFLTLAHQHGVQICINSDSHAPAEVGRHFERARALAREIGFTTTVQFEQGQKRPLPI